MLILLCSAALVAGARRLALLARQGAPVWRAYGRAVAVLAVAAPVVVASGLPLELTEMTWAHSEGYRIDQYKFTNLEGPVKFLSEHVREGDVVLSTAPHVVDHCLELMTHGRVHPWGLGTDYWPQSRLHLQACLDDHRPVPLHRLYGVVMNSTLQGMEDIFARHGRIWYVVDPTFNKILNDEDITAFLRQHMEVVYEDYNSLVMFAGEQNRPAFIRLADEVSLRGGKSIYLP
jgi:hypothetical protein